MTTTYSETVDKTTWKKSKRPSSIQELAQRADISNIWDPTKDLKHWLKMAESARHNGQQFDRAGELEDAFVEYTKAASLILERIPSHREYHTRLDSTQRETLISKGKGVLDRMGDLKRPLVDAHNNWESKYGDREGSSDPTSSTRTSAKRTKSVSRQTSVNIQGMQIWYPDASVVAQEKRRREESQAQAQVRAEQRSRSEQAGIIQRQREAEEASKSARHSTVTSVAPQSNGFVSIPAPSSIPASPAYSMPRPLNTTQYETFMEPPPPLLPLESPTRFDADPIATGPDRVDEQLYQKIAHMSLASKSASSVPSFGGSSYSPITTTSAPPPTLSTVSYPQLMSQHQRTQGYTPSLQSMFVSSHAEVPQQTLLFEPAPQINPYQNISLPSPSVPISNNSSRNYMFGPREPSANRSHSNSPRPNVPTRPSPDTRPYQPHPVPQPNVAPPPPPPQVIAPRIAPASSQERRDLDRRVLKTVNFPREVLPRFISIASLNTSRNRETCGLLLGKQKGEKYVVTTLLIPKQHSTSDTCAMDEEELVLEFTEKRSLMTLGWIHTHPTQSCFMSSVDLHTHSGFQRMLPESFAVVCAPQHTPNFGIFRLTDPPGLQTILDCNETNAFHPHPDLPIYTDADKGHVQMRDLSLEIVDLR